MGDHSYEYFKRPAWKRKQPERRLGGPVDWQKMFPPEPKERTAEDAPIAEADEDAEQDDS